MKNDINSWSRKDSQKKIISKTLGHLYFNESQRTYSQDSKKMTKIACISTYPPRECGIATFSKDLQLSIEERFGGKMKLIIFPLETQTDSHKYPCKIGGVLNTDYEMDFLKVSQSINSNKDIALILIQHEFGLFKNNESAFLKLIDSLKKPVVITFHTVLPNPNSDLRKQVQSLSRGCQEIIVMTKASADILERDYAVQRNKIVVIPHGTHLISNGDKDELKHKYELSGKKVLSTFGLLGPNKNIETTLNALPGIVKKFPEVMFLIIGKTHPSLVKDFGEDYRLFLQQLVDRLSLQDNVRFINDFLPTPQLLQYLQLTDIYLFTSKDPNQAVSGTFAYALSCGCPIVSTPIPHALEVLENQAGVVFDFSDSSQLQQTVIRLLKNPQTLANMSLNGLHTTSGSAWENAAIAHARIFERVGRGMVHLEYSLPALNLKHIKKMTTNVGIVQFCKIDVPALEWGYTLDDNARAMIVFCKHYQLTEDPMDLEYIKKYLAFLDGCFRPDGKFLNYVDEYCHFTSQNGDVNLEDANGRAIWALGYLLSISSKFPSNYAYLNDRAEFLLSEALDNLWSLRSPRAMAFSIKGLSYYALEHGILKVESLIKSMADRLVRLYLNTIQDNWHWFESSFTYGNAVIPNALMLAYIITGKTVYREVAVTTFDFLLDKIFINDMVRVISNKNWFKRGDTFNPEFQGGEQPIDVAYTILALDLFDFEIPDKGYGALKVRAFEWFLGNNPLNQTIYNPCTCGCYDGLELYNVNLNQGAESTLSYLLARMCFRENL